MAAALEWQDEAASRLVVGAPCVATGSERSGGYRAANPNPAISAALSHKVSNDLTRQPDALPCDLTNG